MLKKIFLNYLSKWQHTVRHVCDDNMAHFFLKMANNKQTCYKSHLVHHSGYTSCCWTGYRWLKDTSNKWLGSENFLKKSLKIPKWQSESVYRRRTQRPKEKEQKDKERSTKHTHNTKDWETWTQLKNGAEIWILCNLLFQFSQNIEILNLNIWLFWSWSKRFQSALIFIMYKD